MHQIGDLVMVRALFSMHYGIVGTVSEIAPDGREIVVFDPPHLGVIACDFRPEHLQPVWEWHDDDL